MISSLAEIARCFGKSVTAKSIMNIFDRQVRPDVKLILETLQAGGDPEELPLIGIAKISGGGKGQIFVLAHSVLTARFHFVYFIVQCITILIIYCSSR